MDNDAKSRLEQLELDIAAQTVTLAQLIKDTDEVRQMIAELGFEQHASSVCVLIGGQMECDLKPSYLNQVSSSYLQDNLLTRTIYTKVASRVLNIVSKQGNTVTIRRSGATWEIKTISVHPIVENKIWELALLQMPQQNNSAAVKSVVGSVVGRDVTSDEAWNTLVKDLVAPGGEQLLADVEHELLQPEFVAVTSSVLRTAMADPQVQQLAVDNKPSVETQTLSSRVTEEIIRLPLDVLKLDDAVLMDLLSQKLDMQ